MSEINKHHLEHMPMNRNTESEPTLMDLIEQFDQHLTDENGERDENLELILTRLRAGEYRLARGKWEWDRDKIRFQDGDRVASILNRIFAITKAKE